MKLRRFLPKKLYKKYLLIIGLLLINAGFYILFFIFGQPTIETDYVAQLNELNKPENYNPEDNAWPYYKKAFELYSEPNYGNDYGLIYNDNQKSFSDYNDTEQQKIIEWIEQNEPAWQQFVIASKKPYCYMEYEIHEISKNKEEDFISIPLKELDVPSMNLAVQANNLRPLTYFLGKWHIKVNAETGRTEQAIDDCFAFLNAGFQWQQDKIGVDEIIGIHLHSIGNEGLLKIISENELSLTQLKEIQDRLTNIYKSHQITIDFDSEKLQFLDLVQHTFTKGPFGRGHLIPKCMPSLIQMSSVVVTMGKLDTEPTTREKFMFLAMSLLHIRRNKTIAKYNQYYEKINEIQNMSLYERKQLNLNTKFDRPEIFNYKIHFNSFTKQSKHFLTNLFIPGLLRITKFVPQKKTEYEANITILALKRYAIEKGSYPENLQVLLDTSYIAKLPMDPYSDKPLVYQKKGNDFTLYSLGEDFEDNNGTPLFSGKNLYKWGDSRGKKEGDAVFWPVPNYEKELSKQQ